MDEVPPVVKIIRRRVGTYRVGQRPGPARRITQAGNDLQVVQLGEADDVIVLGPGIDRIDLTVASKIVAAIDEIALPVDLNILPRELLPNPLEARIRDHLQGPVTLLFLDLLMQKDIDPKGVDASVGYGSIGSSLGLGMNEVRREL